MREYTLATARFRESPRLVNKLISYHKRWRVLSYLLYLAADRETFGPLGGATYSRLLELCTLRETASPRVLKTVLALLKFTGFVETVSDGADRRLKHYRPTPRIAVFVHQWLSYAVATLDILQPEVNRSRLLRDEPNLAERFFISAGRSHASGMLLTDRMPEFTAFFAERDGATAVMLTVMLADIDGTPVPSSRRNCATVRLFKIADHQGLDRGRGARLSETRRCRNARRHAAFARRIPPLDLD